MAKNHKWKQDSKDTFTCIKCGIVKTRVRQVYGGWEYFGKLNPNTGEYSTLERPECEAMFYNKSL